MKRLFPLTLMAALIGGVAHAKPHGSQHDNPCMKPGKVLTQDVELSADQRALVEDLKSQRKAHRGDRHEQRREMMLARVETLQGYADGSLSRADVDAQLADTHRDRREAYAEMTDALLALIDSYSADQRAQVMENLDEARTCQAEYAGQREEHHAQRAEKMAQRAEKKADMLLKDIDLSAAQSALFEAWQDGQMAQRQERMAAHEDRGGHGRHLHLEALLNGSANERAHAQMAAERLEAMQAQADLMMDFVDSLDRDQRAQLVQNVDVMVERAQQRGQQGQRKGSKGQQRR